MGDPLDFIKDEYTCPECNEGICQVLAPDKDIPRDNPNWIRMVSQFVEKHKPHGFEL